MIRIPGTTAERCDGVTQPRNPGQNAPYRCAADLHSARDLGFANASAMRFPNLGSMYCRSRGPAESLPDLPRMRQTRLGSFPQNLPFEFCERPVGSIRTRASFRRQVPRDAAPADQPENSAPAPSGHGRQSAAAFRGAHRVAVAHATLDSGGLCPECRRAKAYRQQEPPTLVRFVRHAPLEATVVETEQLRCLCLRASHRLEMLEQQLGMPLSAATRWELLKAATQWIRPGLASGPWGPISNGPARDSPVPRSGKRIRHLDAPVPAGRTAATRSKRGTEKLWRSPRSVHPA